MQNGAEGIHTSPTDRDRLPNTAARGERAVDAAFRRSPPRVFPAGARLFEAPGAAIHRVRHGWAYRLYRWPDGRRAIVDVYLPGDVIGLAAAVAGAAPDPVVAITAATVETIDAPSELPALLAHAEAALYVARLIGEERRRVDRLAAAIARLDARRRVAVMLLDFAERLRRGGAPAALGYLLPLTQ